MKTNQKEIAPLIRKAFLEYKRTSKYDNIKQANDMCTAVAMAVYSIKGKFEAMSIPEVLSVYEKVQFGIEIALERNDMPSRKFFRSLQKIMADEIDREVKGTIKIKRV